MIALSISSIDCCKSRILSSLVLDALFEKKHNLFAYFWTPLDNIKDRVKRDRSPYDVWVKQGKITLLIAVQISSLPTDEQQIIFDNLNNHHTLFLLYLIS